MQQHLMRGVGLPFTEIYTIKLKRPGAKPDPSLKKEYPLKMKFFVIILVVRLFIDVKEY
jgi:hypothetical protein